MAANFNENSSSSECQSNSMIQRTGGRSEKGREKTNGSRRSRRVGGRENFKQEKNKRSREVFSTIKEVYSRGGHMGKKGESEECRKSVGRL